MAEGLPNCSKRQDDFQSRMGGIHHDREELQTLSEIANATRQKIRSGKQGIKDIVSAIQDRDGNISLAKKSFSESDSRVSLYGARTNALERSCFSLEERIENIGVERRQARRLLSTTSEGLLKFNLEFAVQWNSSSLGRGVRKANVVRRIQDTENEICLLKRELSEFCKKEQDHELAILQLRQKEKEAADEHALLQRQEEDLETQLAVVAQQLEAAQESYENLMKNHTALKTTLEERISTLLKAGSSPAAVGDCVRSMGASSSERQFDFVSERNKQTGRGPIDYSKKSVKPPTEVPQGDEGSKFIRGFRQPLPNPRSAPKTECTDQVNDGVLAQSCCRNILAEAAPPTISHSPKDPPNDVSPGPDKSPRRSANGFRTKFIFKKSVTRPSATAPPPSQGFSALNLSWKVD